MAPEPIFGSLWKRKSLVLQAIVIASLIAASVWDSVLIIRTFVNDNRITVIHTGDGTNDPIYLENITFKVRHLDSILPKQWSDQLNITDLPTSTYYEDIVEKTTSGELDLNSIDINTTEGKLLAASLFARLSYMDSYSLFYCLIVGRNACTQFAADYGNLSRILRNGSELTKLREGLFSEFRDALAFDWLERRASIAIHNIGLSDITFEIDDGQLLHDRSSFSGVLLLNKNLHRNGTNFDKGVIVHVLGGRTTATIELEPNACNHIEIDVKNLGIYDKSKTTECTRDLEIHPPLNLKDRPGCDHRSHLKSIVSSCGCIPFVTEKSYRKFESANADLPFCDLQLYKDCAGLFQNPVVECPPSCVTIRNQYTVTNTRQQCGGEERNDDRFAQVRLTLTSSDRSFVIYEDRYQLTISQFLSQLGGEIGLYTGLSLLGIWRMITFIHARYKRYEPKTSARGVEYVLRFLLDQTKTARRASVIHFGPTVKADWDDRDLMDSRRKVADAGLHQQSMA